MEENIWKSYEGKKIFVQLKTGRVYSGKVINVDESSKPLIFITIIDIKQHQVTFVQSEIVSLQVEEEKWFENIAFLIFIIFLEVSFYFWLVLL